LARGARRLALGPARLTADVTRDPTMLTVSLRRLELGDLLPSASGSLRAKDNGGDPTLQLLISRVDLARARAAVLTIAGDLKAVGAIAAIVRAGTLRSLKIASTGGTLAELPGGIQPTAIDVERPVLEVRLSSLGSLGSASDPWVGYRESVG